MSKIIITLTTTEPMTGPDYCLQFFVRRFDQTLVLQANATDTISSVHEKLQSLTDSTSVHQPRLTYQGKQLPLEHTLQQCGVQRDSVLYLVHQAVSIVDDIVSYVNSVCTGNPRPGEPALEELVSKFFKKNSWENWDEAYDNFQIFMKGTAPNALVTLYACSDASDSATGFHVIDYFFLLCKNNLPNATRHSCTPVVLEFCALLFREQGIEDCLFESFKSFMGSLLKLMEGMVTENVVHDIDDLSLFAIDLAITNMLNTLNGKEESPEILSQCSTYVSDVCVLLDTFRNKRTSLIHDQRVRGEKLSRIPACDGEVLICTRTKFISLLSYIDDCLKEIEEKKDVTGCSNYLAILKVLRNFSKLSHGCEEMFWETMKQRKAAVTLLVHSFAKTQVDYRWIIEAKEATSFTARRHLATMMLPKVSNKLSEVARIRVKRSDLLVQSFESITLADLENLRAGISVVFRDEEGIGCGLRKEWVLLVCQAIFNPANNLFVACPDDRRRFFPSAASRVHPLHLEYFRFSGRVIALTLMYELQVGILFDRVFFLQLAGKEVSLEDIQDTDPFLYRSCKQILEMDPETFDQDVLGLTFVHEIEEFGERKSIELLPHGSSIVVNSKNRKQYVDSLIKYVFVAAISEQVASFAQGFYDIVSERRISFFEYLYLEDLDLMLHGSESEISVDDWRAHTRYERFVKTDRQISWFWEVVGNMTKEQKRALLFFWTSIKYLSFEGFKGLNFKLSIAKTCATLDHLPSSHTCYYKLCLPAYDSLAVMRDRLHMVTQEHIGCGFGKM